MRPAHLVVVMGAALGAGLLSFGLSRPRVEREASSAPAPPAASPEPERAAEVPWPPPEVREVEAPARVPDDVRLEVAPLAGGGVSIRVARPGHLVALRHRGAANAGRDWAGIELRTPPGAAAPERDALVWEATEPRGLSTIRGLVRLEGGAARLALAEPPKRGPGLAGGTARDKARDPKARAHDCVSHGDGAGGFVVICRLGREARAARAVNVTGARPLESAWIVDAGKGQGAVARLELPRGAALAEARALTYVRGLEGVVVRAEATWLPGAEPTLLLAEARRAQPTADAVWR